jgi:hypothetical protein
MRAPGNHRPNEDAKVNDCNNARQIEAGSADSQIQRDQEGQTGKHGDGLVDPWVMKKPSSEKVERASFLGSAAKNGHERLSIWKKDWGPVAKC